MRNFALLFVLLFGFASAVFSQTPVQEIVYLKNGSVIKGIIIEQVLNQSIKIRTADGSTFVYKIGEVEKITKEVADSNTYNRRSSGSGGENEITGYRGFADMGYTVGIGEWKAGRIEVTTSHGYQFTPYLFMGGGTGIHYYCTDGAEETVVPLFVDFRANFIKGKIVPFARIKAGYSFDTSESFEGLGFYIAPSAGVKFMVSDNFAINFSLGYTSQLVDSYYEDYYYEYSSTENLGGITFKTGFEF